MDRKRGVLNLRELSGAALLLVLLLAGLLTSWFMGRQHTAAAKELEDSAWLAVSGQWEKARDTARGARESWEKNRKLRSALADQSPIEEIDSLFEALTIYAAAGERTEFARICADLSCRMEAMGNAHCLNWWNVL